MDSKMIKKLKIIACLGIPQAQICYVLTLNLKIQFNFWHNTKYVGLLGHPRVGMRMLMLPSHRRQNVPNYACKLT